MVVGGTDADSRVTDFKAQRGVTGICPQHGDFDFDFSGRGEFHGVGGEVHQDLPDAAGVAHEPSRNIGMAVGDEFQIFALCGLGHESGDFFHECPGVEGGDFQIHFPGFEFGEIQDVVDQREEDFVSSLHTLGVLPLAFAERRVHHQ